MKRLLIIFALLCQGTLTFAQTLNRNWSHQLETEIAQFEGCDEDMAACRARVGKVLKSVYQINDFYSAQKKRYLDSNEICQWVKNSKQWKLLGQGFEQDALKEAQLMANKKRAVVAVYLDDDNLGHLAYILPGELSPSGSWGVRVPNSMAYFLNDPAQSYVNKGLSYSFPRKIITDVYLYVRQY